MYIYSNPIEVLCYTWQFSPGLKLFGTQRVGDVLDGVTQTVSEVIGGVDTPGVPRVGVRGVLDAVGYRILLTVLHNVLHTKCRLYGNACHVTLIGTEVDMTCTLHTD